ncbi:16S rRNA (guanine(527)-N(7))-methyltransferase RsmG [Utexia brackfieldae]|uniref:16S rRNA (guanine(527)-N(7))-methyltransferase RsmG n=1 Tax=Utexia brackfieldae TaxID=3074108 RepID=UPI00370D16BA
MLKNKLVTLLKQNHISITDQQISLLISYVKLLDKWNKAYNLTSVRNPEEMLVKHIIDSLVISPHLVGDDFIDVGTGPGLPGIPLAIINPDKHFTLVDSLGKRIRFLKQVIFELNLTNVEAIQSRIEALTDKKYDGIISRAFASLQDMLNWCEHLPNQTGLFYALKGVYPQDEITLLPKHFTVQETVRFDIPEISAERHLIIIKPLSN